MATSLRPGTTVAHYEILAHLGSGGMGDVFRAMDTRLDREVALKALPPYLDHNSEESKRFQQEAKAIAALRHPNIVTIYSVEQALDLQFITMELVEGRTLSQATPAGGYDLDAFLSIASQLVDAVCCAHQKGITHRDLKPANIMVDEHQHLTVLDFGLAKLLSPESPGQDKTVAISDQLTQAGSVLGTPAYMSPEQILGKPIDHRADIFSLGLIFYEILLDEHPFPGDNPMAVMFAIANAETPSLSLIPPQFRDIIARCLEKSPEDRYATSEELRQALKAISTVGPAGTMEDSALKAESAYKNEEWEAASQAFQRLKQERTLSPQELEMSATCSEWLSDFEESIKMQEMAYAQFKKLGKNTDAARLAIQLFRAHTQKNSATVAKAWFRRADQLLQAEPVNIEHGNLLRWKMAESLQGGDLDRAEELNRQCTEIGDRFRDPDLQTVALHDRGQILIARGQVARGTELVDEAMTSAVSGEVNPDTQGTLYCRTMSVCKALADYNRAQEWSNAAQGWCELYSDSSFPSICSVHRAEAMRQHGQWEEAEETAGKAYDDFMKYGLELHAGEALNELGELARQRGNYQEAEQRFRRTHQLGFDPSPGLPLLRLAQGKLDGALRGINRALLESHGDKLRRAQLLTGSIPILLASGHLSQAQEAIQELTTTSETYDSPTYKAHATRGQGAAELANSNHEAATAILQRAWSLFNGLGFPYEAAHARVLLAQGYMQSGDTDGAELQLEAAMNTFQELGATVDFESTSLALVKLQG